MFVDKQTIKALSDPKPEHLDVLIEINRNIAQGLREQTG
ncbi:MAG: flagellar biosynthesis regulator FlaF [Rhodospirillales bacterium]